MDHITRSPSLIGLMLLAVVVELAWWLRSDRGYDVADAWASVRLAAGHIIFGALNALILGFVFFHISRWTPVHWPIHDWRTWAVGFVLVEFVYYWFHRLSHTIRWLWASHIVHHTTQQVTLLSAIRLGWTNSLSGGGSSICCWFWPASIPRSYWPSWPSTCIFSSSFTPRRWFGWGRWNGC